MFRKSSKKQFVKIFAEYHTEKAKDYLEQLQSFDAAEKEYGSIRFSISVPSKDDIRTVDVDDTVNALLKKITASSNITFVEALMLLIDEKGLKDSQVYRAAGIDRRLFSKIMSDVNYKPSKDTVIALALSLKLPLGEAKKLLSKAGYSLSHSIRRDIIIEYFFERQVYQLAIINEVLHNLDEKILGR